MHVAVDRCWCGTGWPDEFVKKSPKMLSKPFFAKTNA
jgi:hypothetical protein